MKDFKQFWKKLATLKINTARNAVELALLKAIKSKNPNKKHVAGSILLKSFPPITSKIKLANGRKAYDTAEQVVFNLGWSFTKRGNNVVFRDGIKILGVDPLEIFDYQEEVNIFYQLTKDITREYLRRNYIYIFVDTNLSYEQQVVQAAHVTLVLGHALKDMSHVHDLYYTVCGTTNMAEVIKHVRSLGHKYEVFREPDIGNIITAIALHPIHWSKRGDLMDYELLRMPRGETITSLTQTDLG